MIIRVGYNYKKGPVNWKQMEGKRKKRRSSGAEGSQDEDKNVPEGLKMEEAGKTPDGRDGKDRDKDARIIPEGRKEGKKQHPVKPPVNPPVRRVRGKLSKKEEREIKKKHRDIAGMMTPQPAQ